MQVIVSSAGALYVMTQTTMIWSKNYQFSQKIGRVVGWKKR